MWNEFSCTKIEEEDIGNIWFQQDGDMCHTAEATLDVLSLLFEDRIISRRADVFWPPRSCDLIVQLLYVVWPSRRCVLTSLDYYSWGGDKPETIDNLKDNIREAIGEIQLHTNDTVLKNWTDLVGYCMTRRGSHLNAITLHY